MAKVKLKLDERRKKKDGTFPIVLTLSHRQDTARISLKRSLSKNNWDKESMSVVGIDNCKLISAKIHTQLKKAELFIINHQIEVESMSLKELKVKIQSIIFSNDSTSVREIKKYVSMKVNTTSILEYAQGKLKRLKEAKKEGYAKAITTSLNKVLRYSEKNDLLFAEIDLNFLKGFSAYCIGRGNKPNSISAYLRPIKTLFREAIQEGVIPNELNPFPKFQIPKAKNTRKRSLRLEDINAMRNLNLKLGSAHWNARNYFLFMFNNMGMNLIDIAKLKKNQITGAKYRKGKIVEGRLEYSRSKNGRQYSIKLTQESLDILNFYDLNEKSDSDFVFPIGYEESEKGVSRYNTNRKRINRRIRDLGNRIGIKENISSYYARHSWATIAKRKMIPVSVISEGLGHSDSRTTQIYLDSFDDDILDDANDQIVS